MRPIYKKFIGRLIFGIGVLIQFTYPIVATAGSARNSNNSQSVRTQDADLEIKVGVSRQDSMGKTQQDLDQNFISNLETYTVDRVKVKAREYLASIGKSDEKINLTSSAVYVEYGTLKLAVIKINSTDGSNQVWVTGIRDREIIRIVCVRNSVNPIPISYGKCGEKIEEVFGKRIGS